jgi:hypothetical protein
MEMQMQFDNRDKAMLHTLDDTFTISADGKTASVVVEIEIVRHPEDQFQLTFKLPDGEELSMRMPRIHLLKVVEDPRK